MLRDVNLELDRLPDVMRSTCDDFVKGAGRGTPVAFAVNAKRTIFMGFADLMQLRPGMPMWHPVAFGLAVRGTAESVAANRRYRARVWWACRFAGMLDDCPEAVLLIRNGDRTNRDGTNLQMIVEGYRAMAIGWQNHIDELVRTYCPYDTDTPAAPMRDAMALDGARRGAYRWSGLKDLCTVSDADVAAPLEWPRTLAGHAMAGHPYTWYPRLERLRATFVNLVRGLQPVLTPAPWAAPAAE